MTWLGPSDETPAPPRLTHGVWIDLRYGNESMRLLCGAAEIVHITRFGKNECAAEPCLSAVCLRKDDFDAGVNDVRELLIPLKYITYITQGPELQVVSKGGDRTQLILLPTPDTPDGAMTEEQVEAKLREFGPLDD